MPESIDYQDGHVVLWNEVTGFAGRYWYGSDLHTRRNDY